MTDARVTANGVRLVTVALLAGVAFLLLPFLSGLIGGAVLYVVAAPLTHRLDRLGYRRTTAFVATLLLFFVLVLPAIWLLIQLFGQVPDLIRRFREAEAVQRIMAVHVGAVDVGSHLERASGDIVAWSSRQTFVALNGALGATLNLIVALFGAYYLLVSGTRVWERVKAMLPFSEDAAELLRIRFHRVTEAMLLGVVLTGAAQGALVGAAFALLGFDHALFWGAVTAGVSILPVFGSAIVWFPATLMLLAQQRFAGAIGLAAFGLLLVSNVDNGLRLVVYKRVSQIHPMVTLVGAFAGVRALGVPGVLLGPLVISYAIELLRIRGSNRLGSPAPSGQGFPLDTPAISPTPVAASTP